MKTSFFWATVALLGVFGCIVGAAIQAGYGWVAIVLGLAAVGVFMCALWRGSKG